MGVPLPRPSKLTNINIKMGFPRPSLTITYNIKMGFIPFLFYFLIDIICKFDSGFLLFCIFLYQRIAGAQ